MLPILFQQPKRAAPFSPANIAGLILWLKADAITGLNDGDAIATWPDSSASANNATQSTANRKPIYKTNIVNGRPIARFDALNTIMQFGANIDLGAAFSIFIVLNKTAARTGYNSAIRTKQVEIETRYSSGDTWGTYVNGDRKTTTQLTSTFALVEGIFRAANDVDLHTNGGSATNFTAGTSFEATTTSWIGGNTTGSQLHQGDIAEVLIYSSALGAADRQRVETYLNSKYALY